MYPYQPSSQRLWLISDLYSTCAQVYDTYWIYIVCDTLEILLKITKVEVIFNNCCERALLLAPELVMRETLRRYVKKRRKQRNMFVVWIYALNRHTTILNGLHVKAMTNS